MCGTLTLATIVCDYNGILAVDIQVKVLWTAH